MSKESFVFILGALVLLTPFLGIPRDYKEWILAITGGLLMICGYQLRRKRFIASLTKGEGERKSDAFTESSGVPKMATEDPHTGGLAI